MHPLSLSWSMLPRVNRQFQRFFPPQDPRAGVEGGGAARLGLSDSLGRLGRRVGVGFPGPVVGLAVGGRALRADAGHGEFQVGGRRAAPVLLAALRGAAGGDRRGPAPAAPDGTRGARNPRKPSYSSAGDGWAFSKSPAHVPQAHDFQTRSESRGRRDAGGTLDALLSRVLRQAPSSDRLQQAPSSDRLQPLPSFLERRTRNMVLRSPLSFRGAVWYVELRVRDLAPGLRHPCFGKVFVACSNNSPRR